VAALEGVPMRMTVFTAGIDREPQAPAELAALGWAGGADEYLPRLAPAVRDHVVPPRSAPSTART
jgi:8-oxo-dGTP diphosphatase